MWNFFWITFLNRSNHHTLSLSTLKKQPNYHTKKARGNETNCSPLKTQVNWTKIQESKRDICAQTVTETINFEVSMNRYFYCKLFYKIFFEVSQKKNSQLIFAHYIHKNLFCTNTTWLTRLIHINSLIVSGCSHQRHSAL